MKAIRGIMAALVFASILLLAFHSQPVEAYGAITGKVTELDGVTAVTGALVEALQQGDFAVASATTNNAGYYSIAVSEGPYKVRASANNYITAMERLVNVIGFTNVNFNLTKGRIAVFDEFTGNGLNTSTWNSHITGPGYIVVYNETSQPTNFSIVVHGTSGGGSAAISSKVNVSLASVFCVIFEGRVAAYTEGGIGQIVYGNRQPRGLRVGTDENNAIEFRSASSAVEARTVSSGVATTTNYYLGSALVNTWNCTYKIVATSSTVKFYLNGTLIATHTTNIPTGLLNVYMGTSYVGGGNIPVAADYLYLAVQEPQTVGGVWASVNKSELLAPYIGSAALLLATDAAVAIYVKKKPRKTKP